MAKAKFINDSSDNRISEICSYPFFIGKGTVTI